MRLKVALIGCGNVSSRHLEAYERINGVSVDCVADIDVSRAKATAERYGIPRAVSTVEEALEGSVIDFVDVCTPAFAHRDVVITAAQAGKHVVCEKPLALTGSDALEMTEACRQAGVKLMVAFRHRFTRWASIVRERMLRGDLGRPIIWREVLASSGPKMRYMFDRDKAGGFFMDFYVHHIDMGHYLFGESRSVLAVGGSLKANLPSPDTGTAVLTFEQGDQLVITATLGLPGWDWVWRAGSYSDFVGPLGLLKDGLFTGGSRDFITFVKSKDSEERIEFPPQLAADSFYEELSHFVDCIRRDQTPLITGEDGIRATRTVEAIYRQIEANAQLSPVDHAREEMEEKHR